MARTPAGTPHDPRGGDRFNEERAAYTVSSAQPDLEGGVQAIRETVKVLKPVPGVYRMCDARGEVLYVGKARSLKARVANYVQVAALSNRLQRMVSQTRSMEIVVTNSEAEALLLEAQLIKRFRPPFNVLLRDDKSFPFILLRADHAFPRIQKHRGARKAKGNYYGPFASAGSVNTTINGGTLQLGDGVTDGSIASTSAITNNGTLAYNNAGALTQGVVISGTVQI